jgi:hypothetical protein
MPVAGSKNSPPITRSPFCSTASACTPNDAFRLKYMNCPFIADHALPFQRASHLAAVPPAVSN